MDVQVRICFVPDGQSRRVSILVLGSNVKKWNKNWNKFELRLDNFTPIFIPIFGGPKFSGMNIRNWNCLRIFPNLNVPKVGIKIGKCLDYVPKLQNCDPKNNWNFYLLSCRIRHFSPPNIFFLFSRKRTDSIWFC
jgi:hypothetical protein